MGILGWNPGGLRKQATFIQEFVAGKFALNLVILQESENVTDLMRDKYHVIQNGYLSVAFAKWFFEAVKDEHAADQPTSGTWGITLLCATGVLRKPLPCGTAEITACSAHLNNTCMRKPEVGRTLCDVLKKFMVEHNVDIAHADFNEGVHLRGARVTPAVEDTSYHDDFFQADTNDPRWLFSKAEYDCCGFLVRKTRVMQNMRVQRQGSFEDLHDALALKPRDQGAHAPNFLWLAHLSVSEAERRGQAARDHRQRRAETKRDRKRRRHSAAAEAENIQD
jgi:hypothetical protein